MERRQLKTLVRKTLAEFLATQIPIGISNRHIHLSTTDFKTLFPKEELTKLKDLKQPGEFAAEQTVTIIGPKGSLEKVRILGPLRQTTQVEISQTDNRQIGLQAPIKLSGDLAEAAEVTICSTESKITRKAGIVAQRHIHMDQLTANWLQLKSGDKVKVQLVSPQRSTIFDDVAIRVSPQFKLEMHLDTDEANAAGATNDLFGTILTDREVSHDDYQSGESVIDPI